MTSMSFYIHSINITWIKCLTDPENKGALKIPYVHEIEKHGRFLLIKCNYAENKLKLLRKKNTFFKDVLYCWCLLILMRIQKKWFPASLEQSFYTISIKVMRKQ